MSTFKGDFLGFSYNGVHCSELGIFRVSSGDRYQINLSPTSKLQTVEVPGADGTYYFGKSFTQKIFKIDFAFDHVNDEQLRRIKQLLNTKGIHELIFDEEPYKVWDVQINGIPQLKTIPFDEGNVYENFGEIYNTYLTKYGERIYKGEGSIDFICYSPWAHSPKGKKYLSDYPEWKYENKSQWAAASGLPEDKFFIDENRETKEYGVILNQGAQNSNFYIFNAGDIEAPISLKLYIDSTVPNFNVKITNNQTQEVLIIEIPKLLEGDCGIEISSKTLLINGINKVGEKTGTLYNRYITAGNFLKISTGFNSFSIFNETENIASTSSTVDYQYLYH